MRRPDPEFNVDEFLEAWWKASRRVRRNLPFIILFIVPLFGIFVWLFWPVLRMTNLRSRRKLAVVLWLRRFHRGSQSKALFQVWQGAARPWGQVLTLTDRDVRQPMPATTIAVMGGGFAIAAFVLFLTTNAHNGSPMASLSDVIAAAFAGLMFAGGFILLNSKRSVTRLRTLADASRIARRAHRIRSDKLLVWSLGSATIQCPADDDEIWRAAISALAPEVSVVILDYGDDISSNVEWEVNTLLRICGPQKILLAVPQPAEAVLAAASPVQSKIRGLFGSAFAPETIFYPQKIPRGWNSPRVEAIVRPAQRIIGVMTQGPGLVVRNAP